MLRRVFKSFGLFVGGVTMFVGGGLTLIYGMLLFYTASPGGPTAQSVMGPLNRILLDVLTNHFFLVVAFVGLGVFAVDVSRNGLLNLDDRLYVEKKKDWRRQKAEESEAWDPPPEDRESPTVYDELMEQVQSSDLVLEAERADLAGQPSVRGVIRNTTAQLYRNVRVEITFLDDDGEEVATRLPTTKTLHPATSWEFEAFYSEQEDVAGYEISTPRGEADESS